MQQKEDREKDRGTDLRLFEFPMFVTFEKKFPGAAINYEVDHAQKWVLG